MKVVYCVALMFLIINVDCQKTTRSATSGLGGEARGAPSSESYSVNILAKYNSSYTLPLVIGPRDSVTIWLLTRQTISSFQQNNETVSNTIAVYDPRPQFNPRPPNILNAFPCMPNETVCNTISINELDASDLGIYTFRFDTVNYVSKAFQFNVSAYIEPIVFSCNSSSLNRTTCIYNAVTQTLSVLADQSVLLSSSINVMQNDLYPISAQFSYGFQNGLEDCAGQTSSLTQLPDSIASQYSVQNYNIILKQLSKYCSKTFSRGDLSKFYTSKLNPTPLSPFENSMYQRNASYPYESLLVQLDVQYGPDPTIQLNSIPISYQSQFNTTSMYGTKQVVFSCPFTGNPTPVFYWRLVSSSSQLNGSIVNNTSTSTQIILSNQIILTNTFTNLTQNITVLNSQDVGQYVFECQAQVLGLVQATSQPVQFGLTIIPQPLPPPRSPSTNTGAIIGGVIGGVAFLIILIIAILLLLRYARFKKNPKDEIEKAKELDIDITDNVGDSNPHLIKKSNSINNQQSGKLSNGIGHKVIAGLMVPNSTAQSYAAIAHAAAAAAQTNQQRNIYNSNNNNNNGSVNFFSDNLNANGGNISNNNFNNGSNASNTNNNLFNSGSHNNLLTNNTKSQSYNNPGFFESTSYSIQNPLESPPPYDAALHQPIKKDSPIQQQQQQQQQHLLQNQQQQQKDYMGGSNSRLLSELNNTPVHQKQINPSHSYSVSATPQQQNLSLINSTPTMSSSLQQLQYQNQMQPNLQYTSVHNLENRARSRNPLNGLSSNDIENQQQQFHPQTQYTTMAAQLSSNPIDV